MLAHADPSKWSWAIDAVLNRTVGRTASEKNG